MVIKKMIKTKSKIPPLDFESKFYFLALVFIIIFSLFVETAKADLVAHWNFEDTLTDRINNHVGVLIDGNYTNSGYLNKGFLFDGVDDAVRVDSSIITINKTPVSINFWMLNNEPTSNKVPFSFGASGSSRYFRILMQNTQKSVFTLRYDVFRFDTVSNETINQNDWVMVSFIQDGIEPKIFFDMIEQNLTFSSNNDTTWWLNNSPLINTATFGALYQSGAYSSQFNGTLDEIKYFNHSLNTSDLWNLFYSNSITCEEDWSYTIWQTFEYQDGFYNQTRTKYDANICYGSTNTTEYKTVLFTEGIQEALEMGFLLFGLIILWAFLWAFGYYAIQSFNTLIGGMMILMTIPIDLYFMYFFQETLITATGFIGIAFGLMIGFTIGSFPLIKRKKKLAI